MEVIDQQAGQCGGITLTFFFLSPLYGARTTLASNFGGVLGKQVFSLFFYFIFSQGYLRKHSQHHIISQIYYSHQRP